MNNCLRCTLNRFKCLSDNMLSRLSQYLNRNIIWNQILLDQGTDKRIFRLRCRRKTNFDLFKSYFDKQFKELNLLLQAHRNDQCLVSVTKVNTTPDRCLIYIFFFSPFHTFHWRHKILSLIFCYVFHNFPPFSVRIVTVHSNLSKGIKQKKSSISTDYCKRRKTTTLAVPLLFMNGFIHSRDTESSDPYILSI